MQDSSLLRDPILEVALNQYPDQAAEVIQQVKSIVDDWRAGKVPSLNQAFTEQLGLGALPDPYQLRCPPPGADIATPTSFSQYPSQPPMAAGPLPNVHGLLPLHRDPSDDMLEQDMSPPLGTMPVFHRGMRAAMRPTKARVLSRPGRGPMPLPISVHPQARPFGVAQSSLALREAAQLRAMDPTARQLVSRRHAPPRLEPPPKLEPCLPEGFEMPDKLPSPETAVTLLAQANRANERYLKLPKQPQNASQYAPPAVLGADGATAGTAADFIKDHPLINPRANTNPAAAPQAIAAPAAPVVAPKAAPSLPPAPQQLASPAQPINSLAQTPPRAAPLPATAPATSLPAGSTAPSSVATDPPSSANQLPAASTAEEIAAAVDNVEDDIAGQQNGKPGKQRLGQKQRKRQREIAEQKKVEDDAKAAAEAERIRQAEAEAKEVQAAEAKARAAEKAAKAAEEAQQAETKRAEEARAEQAAAAMRQAELASFKAAEELLASEEAAVQGKTPKLAPCHICIA